MAQCDPQTLLSASNVWQGLPGGTLELVKTALLCKLFQAANPMAVCDPQSLLSAAKCFACLSAGELALIQTQLLCEILVAGGTGSIGACLFTQSGPPVTPCTFQFGLSYDNDPTSPTAGSFYFWDSTNSVWVPFLTGL